MSQGKVAMWYDATSAAGSLEARGLPGARARSATPRRRWSRPRPRAGCTPGRGASRRPARSRTTPGSSSPGRPARSTRTSSARKLGWSKRPGRQAGLDLRATPTTSRRPRPFAEPTETAIDGADPSNPGVQPRPAIGIQFVDIPEFTDLGTKVSQDDQLRHRRARPASTTASNEGPEGWPRTSAEATEVTGRAARRGRRMTAADARAPPISRDAAAAPGRPASGRRRDASAELGAPGAAAARRWSS